jgi:hypothetical protein
MHQIFAGIFIALKGERFVIDSASRVVDSVDHVAHLIPARCKLPNISKSVYFFHVIAFSLPMCKRLRVQALEIAAPSGMLGMHTLWHGFGTKVVFCDVASA